MKYAKFSLVLVFLLLIPFASAADDAFGGNITSLNIGSEYNTRNWFALTGHYNLGASVDGVCNTKGVSGWILYTNGSSLPSNITQGDLDLLDEFISSEFEDNGSNTFSSLSNFTVFGQLYTDVPTAYNVNASAGIYVKEGYFNSFNGDLVFVIQVQTSEMGYGENSFEYQSLMPLKNKSMVPWEMFNNIVVQCTKPVCPTRSSSSKTCITLQPNEDIILSMEEMYISLKPMEFKKEFIYIANQKDSQEVISLSLQGDGLANMVVFNELTKIIPPDSIDKVEFMVLGNQPRGTYEDVLIIRAGLTEKYVPMTVRIYEESDRNLDIDLKVLDDEITSKDNLKYQLTLRKAYGGVDIDQLNIKAIILAIEEEVGAKITGAFIAEQERKQNKSSGYVLLPEEEIDFDESASIIRKVDLPKDFKNGRYHLHVFVDSGTGDSLPASATFEIRDMSFLEWLVGWPLIIMIVIGLLVVKSYAVVSKYIYSKTRYHFNVKMDKLPQKSASSLFLGNIPGQKEGAYLNPDNLTTHALVAGTTGSGKSITAQVIAEEALLKGIPVLVFDPTKQWSGFLRKCEDKNMLKRYSQFGLRKSKAQAFNGNVYSVRDPRELFDINQFFKKGEINILCIDKLKDEDIDLFIANTVTQFFKVGLQESPTLRLLVIYDEVHRLIPGFGGKSEIGAGFLQLERACREFRKWGIGLMLISQLNTDFIGATKANINTQVQLRTTDETDLKMLEKKFSTELIKSVFKADVGNGIFSNPAYNDGKPYFITFRPILHNTRSLSDEILDQYQKYNEIFKDLSFKIEKLKERKKDVLDYEIELNLALKQIRKSKFEVAKIYLEELQPKVDKDFKKLGIKVQKNLIDEKEIAKEVAQAKKERAKYTEALKKELDNLKAEITKFKDSVTSKSGPEAKEVGASLAKLLSKVNLQKTKPTEKGVQEVKATLADLREKMNEGDSNEQNKHK
jgi:hypothetical protein